MSASASWSAWPRCRSPVTFGGGCAIAKLRRLGSGSAVVQALVLPGACQRSSTPSGLYSGSMRRFYGALSSASVSGSEIVDHGIQDDRLSAYQTLFAPFRIRKHRARILARAQFQPPRSQSAPVPILRARPRQRVERSRMRNGLARPLGRIERPYTAEDVARLRGSVQVEHTLARLGAERLWSLLHSRAVRPCARRADRQPGRADGQGRARGRSTSPAGRSPPTRTSPGTTYPGPEPLSGQQRAGARPADQQRPAARRPDRRARRATRRPTGWRRSSPTPRPASAARSTRSS